MAKDTEEALLAGLAAHSAVLGALLDVLAASGRLPRAEMRKVFDKARANMRASPNENVRASALILIDGLARGRGVPGAQG